MGKKLDQGFVEKKKPFNDLNDYLRQKFGGKVFKIPIDAGFTCPNRDGSKSIGGCAFCGSRGSGDFTGGARMDLVSQFEQGRQMMHRKWKQGSYIIYLQAFSNTYAPAERLEEVYGTLLNQEGVVGIAIATRPDCLPEKVLDLLASLNRQTYLWVELGLQTVHEVTARAMNLQYSFADFKQAVSDLQARNIEVCGHIILGLPGESHGDMLATALAAVGTGINGLKIHLFHLMKDSTLARDFDGGNIRYLEQAEYVGLVVDILEQIPPGIVIHRLTGDGPRNLLLGPRWSLNKWEVLNAIDDEFRRRGTWQGRLWKG